MFGSLLLVGVVGALVAGSRHERHKQGRFIAETRDRLQSQQEALASLLGGEMDTRAAAMEHLLSRPGLEPAVRAAISAMATRCRDMGGSRCPF
jgi:hypothetical protein